MRRWWLILICSVLVSLQARAEQFGDFGYVVTSSNTVTITDYTGSGGHVVIPAEILGKAVTAIGQEAFSSSDGLTDVTLPQHRFPSPQSKPSLDGGPAVRLKPPPSSLLSQSWPGPISWVVSC